MTTPNALVVIGDTDHWSTELRGTSIAYDSTLLRCRNIVGGAWQSIVGAGSRTFDASAQTARAFAVFIENGTGHIFGLTTPANAAAVTASFAGVHTPSFGYSPEGYIYLNGVQTLGWPTATTGDLIEFLVRYDTASAAIKIIVRKNGAAIGTEQSIASGTYQIVASIFTLDHAAMLRVDADELDLSDGYDPWGASARVADIGGYSPAASELDPALVSSSGLNIDTFRRVIAGTTSTAWRSVATDVARSVTGRPRYIEILLETAITAIHFGIVRDGTALPSYAGEGSGNWGYDLSGGNKWNNNSATGVTGAATTAAGTRCGMILDAAGNLYLTKADAVLEGDPEAGTGASFTAVTGAFRVLLSAVYADSARVRLCTHAREQLYRPAYCDAWDGADLLPEQHFKGTLSGNPEFERRIHFPIPWGGSAPSGPVGSIDMANDGTYDGLLDYNLRDQECNAYRIGADGIPSKRARLICDNATAPSMGELRVMLRSRDALLERHVDAELFVLGRPTAVPLRQRSSTALDYNIGHRETINTIETGSVTDKGITVTDWKRLPGGGIRRTVAPAGLQALLRPELVRSTGVPMTVTNGTFSAWTADNPDGWTTTEAGTGVVTQSSGCQFVGGAANTARISQSLSSTPGFVIVTIVVSAVLSGDLTLRIERVSDSGTLFSTSCAFSGVGTYRFGCKASAGVASRVVIEASAPASNVTITSVAIEEAEATSGTYDNSLSAALRHLFIDLAGMPPGDVHVDTNTSLAAGLTLGYWSDSNPTIKQVLRQILDPLQFTHYVDVDGAFRFCGLTRSVYTALSGIADYTLEEGDIVGDLVVEMDLAPLLSSQGMDIRNYVLHSETDLAGGVTSSNRTQLAREARVNKAFNSTGTDPFTTRFHTFYAFAENAPPTDRPLYWGRYSSFFANNDNCIVLLRDAYRVKRSFYRLECPRSVVDGIAPGSIVELTHSRYGLSSGKNLAVVAIREPLLSPNVRLTLWG